MSLVTPAVSLTDLRLQGSTQNVIGARGDKIHIVRLKEDGTYEGSDIVMDPDSYNFTQSQFTTSINPLSLAGTMTGHIIPDQNAAYDLGSAEYKIRHLFLSDNSISIGDRTLSSQNLIQIRDVPETSSSVGVKGDIGLDDSFMYVCTSENTWKRITLSDF